MLVGLNQINIELTSRCDRASLCAFCGHQNDSINPNLQYGDMDFGLVESIARQISPPIVVQFHRDGDPLAAPRLGEALTLFRAHPVSIVTHGEALGKRADEIIGNATSVTVSVIPKDPDRELQLESLRAFIEKKGDQLPMLQLKFVGTIENPEVYESLKLPIIGRALHSARGNWSYRRAEPPVPEIRVCMEMLSHPCIDWRGRVFACTRLDPNDEGLIGDLNTHTLDEIWNGPERARMLKAHLAGRRDLSSNLCKSCNYWGLPAAL